MEAGNSLKGRKEIQKKCKKCGDQFPKKEKNWQSITKLKAPNPTVQRDLLERRVIY